MIISSFADTSYNSFLLYINKSFNNRYEIKAVINKPIPKPTDNPINRVENKHPKQPPRHNIPTIIRGIEKQYKFFCVTLDILHFLILLAFELIYILNGLEFLNSP